MPQFEIGQPVRILDGPFDDFIGVVCETDTTGDVIRIGVGVPDREVLVDIDQYRLGLLR